MVDVAMLNEYAMRRASFARILSSDTGITEPSNPMYRTTIAGKPPQEDYHMGKAVERIFLPLVKLMVPELVDYDRQQDLRQDALIQRTLL